MPWKETCAMDQKKSFIKEYLEGMEDFKSLCKRYEISEKTGHKWKRRFMEDGYNGLSEESRSPKNTPGELDEDTVIRVIKMRSAHPTWGPKKLAVLYERAYPGSKVPSESSIYRVLGKAEMITKRRIKSVRIDESRLRQKIEANEPNDVWTVDFKGWWMSSGEKCIPLTIRDLYSKWIFKIRLMDGMTGEEVKKVFEELFRRYGLPKAIRSDNGTPDLCKHAHELHMNYRSYLFMLRRRVCWG